MSDAPLRFADRPGTQVQRHVAASPDAVWDHVVDITLPTTASDELARVEWLGEVSAAAVGARFRGHNERGELRWSTTCEVTACTPPTADAPGVLEWTVLVDPDVAEPVGLATWAFEVSTSEDGTTRLTQRVQVGPGPSGLTWGIDRAPEREHEIIARRLEMFEANMARNLAAVAARVEGHDADDTA